MFKVGDRVRINKINDKLYDVDYIITSIIDIPYSDEIYAIESIETNINAYYGYLDLQYAKKYYRKNRISKLLDIL